MKKGLRPTCRIKFTFMDHSNRRPDEEGIKTETGTQFPDTSSIPTADLMKKGLRHYPNEEHLGVGGIPTADLMKKGLRHPSSTLPTLPCIPTADLMKKGLRRSVRTHLS